MEDPTQIQTCPECGGLGHKIEVDFDELEEYEVDCEICDGKGEVVMDKYIVQQLKDDHYED